MGGTRGLKAISCAALAGALFSLLALAACSSAHEPAAPPIGALPTRTLVPPTPPLTPTPTDLPGAAALRPTLTPVPATPSPAQRMVTLTLADLLAARELAPADVRLLSLEAFTWSDSAWNCAARAAGASPPLATGPGFRVVFAVGGQAVVYHTDEQGAFFVCEDRAWLAQHGTPVLLDPIAEALLTLAQADAARRLGIAPDALQPLSVLTLTWPDASLGCPRPGAEYDSRETPGYRIVLQAPSSPLIYHASAREAVLCAPADEILPGIVRDALPPS